MGWGFVPSYKSQRRSFGSGVANIWKNINNIYDQLNVEVKVHDVNHGEMTLGSNPLFIELTDIDLGITGTGSEIDTGYRVGNSIRLKSIQVKGHLKHNSSNNNVQQCRVMLIKHYDNFLGNPLDYNQLYDTNTSESNIDFLNQFRNLDNTRQYKVLATRTVELLPTNNDKHSQTVFNIFKSYKGKRSGSYVKWEGGDGQDPSNGKYYIMLQSNQSTNLPTVELSSRIKYIDN